MTYITPKFTICLALLVNAFAEKENVQRRVKQFSFELACATSIHPRDEPIIFQEPDCEGDGKQPVREWHAVAPPKSDRAKDIIEMKFWREEPGKGRVSSIKPSALASTAPSSRLAAVPIRVLLS